MDKYIRQWRRQSCPTATNPKESIECAKNSCIQLEIDSNGDGTSSAKSDSILTAHSIDEPLVSEEDLSTEGKTACK